MTLNRFISDLLASRGMDHAALCHILGYKSRTSLNRILSDLVREDTLLRFEQDMNTRLHLTRTESDALHSCVLERCFGGEYVAGIHEVAHLIAGGYPRSDAAVSLACPHKNLGTLLAHCTSVQNASLTVVNCITPELFGTIARLPEHGIPVKHFISDNPAPSLFCRALNTILCVFSHPLYEAYFVPPDAAPMCFRQDDAMFLTYTDDAGTPASELILPRSPKEALSVAVSVAATELMPAPAICRALKSGSSDPLGSIASLISTLAELEKDCEMYDLKPDPCFSLIPTGVLLKAFTDSGFGDLLGTEMLVTLYDCSKARETNIYTKKKPSHCLMQYSSLETFAETGRLSDHLAGLRPFTPKERAAILTRILDAEKKNPYFNLHLLDDESLLPALNMCVYHGRACFIAAADNSYISNSASHLLLTPPAGFYDLFAHYCKDELIAHHSLKPSAVKTRLQALIERCNALM